MPGGDVRWGRRILGGLRGQFKVAKNGKTVTFKTQGTNAKGERIDYELVFDKG